jgi:nucleoside-diphosphate-sugar epimerase
MRTAIVTGGAGSFGGVLKRRLLADGWRGVSLDLQADDDVHPNLRSVRVELTDADAVEKALGAEPIRLSLPSDASPCRERPGILVGVECRGYA